MRHIFALVLTLIVVATVNVSVAQEKPFPYNQFSFGVSAGEIGRDATVAVDIGTPAFFNRRIGFRMKGGIAWLEAYKATQDRWTSYNIASFSVTYTPLILENGRVYVDIGTYSVFPGIRFSDNKVVQGVMGSAGIELFVVASESFHATYYFSGGAGYSSAYAEKMENRPRYANGFLFSNGFRFYFKGSGK